MTERDTPSHDCKHKHMLENRAPPNKFGVLYTVCYIQNSMVLIEIRGRDIYYYKPIIMQWFIYNVFAGLVGGTAVAYVGIGFVLGAAVGIFVTLLILFLIFKEVMKTVKPHNE